MSMRKQGDIESLDLSSIHPRLAKVEIKHKGPGWARLMNIRLQKILGAENGRIIKMRREYTEAEWPELYSKTEAGNAHYTTAEGAEALLVFSREMLAECVQNPPVSELEYLGALEAVTPAALKVQNLDRAESF